MPNAHELRTTYPYRMNPARLDEQLRTHFGAAYRGLRISGEAIHVVLTRPTIPADSADLNALLDAHDPRESSTAERDTQQQAAALADMLTRDAPLSLADYADEPPHIQRLAYKVALIERLLKRQRVYPTRP